MAYTGKYPTRPNAEDCSFFIRTGTCKFGSSCKFNHPVLTQYLVDGDKSNGNGGGSSSKIPCKFYSAGLCKYGDSCRYNHSILEAENLPMQVNYLGYPKRLGKMKCSFYMRTGMCGYGVSCRFHHPDPIMIFPSGPISNHKEAVNSTQSNLSLPLGKKVCWNNENLGLCKWGRVCAYDHPKKHSSSSGSTSASPSCVMPQENITP